MDTEQITRLRDWLSALLEARSTIEGASAGPLPLPVPPVDANLFARNLVLGGSGNKAALLGTVASEPTVDRDDLRNAGLLAGMADDLIIERDELRRQAFELAPAEGGK